MIVALDIEILNALIQKGLRLSLKIDYRYDFEILNALIQKGLRRATSRIPCTR